MRAAPRRRLFRTLVASVVAAAACVTFAPASTASVVTEWIGTASYSCTRAAVDWVVPAGVTNVGFDATGASGAGSASSGHDGGFGAHLTGSFPVMPGETLRVRVGCSDGFNGGGTTGFLDGSGSGGGATDIRQGGDALANRIVTAGGGGGGGGLGAGGTASGPTGGNGSGGLNDGRGATLTEGGWRGGTLGQGGDGEPLVAGGGGGGGVYGGGGSGDYQWCDICTNPTSSPGGGGGAGSSSGPSGTTYAAAASFGDGSLTLSWTVTATTAPTTTVVATSPNPSGLGDDVTATAAVTSDGSPVTVGSVTFVDGVGNTATVPIGTDGTASVSLTGLSLGSQVITATYVPATGFAGSNGQVSHTVGDTAGPVVSVSFPDPGPTGWFANPVGGTISATDGGAITSLGCSAFGLFGMNGLGTGSVSAGMTIAQHGAFSFTCTATDAAGNSTTSPVQTVRVDLLAPAVIWVGGPAAGSTYELGSVPAAPECIANDGDGSGAASCTVTGYSTALGTHTMAATGIDLVGRSRTVTRTYSVADTTGPAVDTSFPAAPASGWFTGPVSGSVSASDLDAVMSLGCSGATLTSPFGLGTAAAGGDIAVDAEGVSTVMCAAVDRSGNASTSSPDEIRIDSTDPAVSWSGGPADGSSHSFGSVPAAPTCSAVDDLSGPAGCVVTGYSTGVGPHVLTATATDVAGNSVTATRTYTVRPWQLLGFYSPVDMGGVVNTVRGGTTVPLKFEVLIDGVDQTSTTVVRTVRTMSVTCDSGAAQDEIEVTSSGATTLRYDATSGQFIYDWKTPRTGGCLDVIVETLDGSTISARFRLR